MSDSHEKPPRRRAARVSEAAPVQVFLGRDDRDRLDRLTEQLDSSKSDVLRRSLVALERQLLDPQSHPALRIVGLVDTDAGAVGDSDIAVNHDRYLSEAYDQPSASAGRRRRGK